MSAAPPLKQGDGRQKWGWNSGEGNLRFAYEQLTEKDFDFFDSLPITFRYEKEGYPAITFCHGSPVSTRERLLTDGQNTRGWLEKVDTEYMICGHTHLAGELAYQGNFYYNCGSVGLAIGDSGFARCMILEGVQGSGGAEWKCEFLKIPYNCEKVVEDICKSGLLDSAPWFVNSNIQILLTGIDFSLELVALARKLVEEAGERGFPAEKYWEEAANRLDVPDYRQRLFLLEGFLKIRKLSSSSE